MKKRSDLVFECRKCNHLLYLADGALLDGRKIAQELETECPNCGEESGRLWIFIGLGSFSDEYGGF